MAVQVTALGAAAGRALHLLDDGLPKVLEDEFALALLGWSADGARQVVAAVEQPGDRMTSLAVGRARFAEDRVIAACRRGVRQYVVLGAGLDSFALRHAKSLAGLTVFEVDDASLLAWKGERFEQLGLAVPSALRFVACDFESTPLSVALSEAGFVSEERAVVSWLGVTQYLTLEAIKQTFEWVARLPAGSEIVLTFDLPCAQAESMKTITRERGIRFETFFEPDEMLALLGGCGLAGEVFTPAQLNELYFRGRDDGLHAHTWEWLAVGRVG